MGCNHRKAHKALTWTWKRKDKNSIVKEDWIEIFLCPACGAIRFDKHNEFCYGKGTFSLPNLTQREKI